MVWKVSRDSQFWEGGAPSWFAGSSNVESGRCTPMKTAVFFVLSLIASQGKHREKMLGPPIGKVHAEQYRGSASVFEWSWHSPLSKKTILRSSLRKISAYGALPHLKARTTERPGDQDRQTQSRGSVYCPFRRAMARDSCRYCLQWPRRVT